MDRLTFFANEPRCIARVGDRPMAPWQHVEGQAPVGTKAEKERT